MRTKVSSITLLAGIVLILLPVAATGAFSGTGSGTAQDPYIITNVDQLQEMNDDLTAWYELGNDIDASATENWNNGAGFDPIGNSTDSFSGHLDGKGYKITGLRSGHYIKEYTHNNIGLFGIVDVVGEIKNIGLVDVYIRGPRSWYQQYGTLASSNGGIITNCYATGIVRATMFVGGLVGVNGGTIKNCYSSVEVDTNWHSAGGLVGKNSGIINECYATGNVSGTGSTGGLAGKNVDGGIVNNSYATGNVSCEEGGGLVGFNHRGRITNSYSTGSVIRQDPRWPVGGLVGDLTGWPGDSTGDTINSFWDIETSGQSESSGGTGKSTAEMKTKATFTDVGWDFVNIWDIHEGATYPFLREVGPEEPPEIDSASIVSFDPPTGTLDRGDVVQATVTVRNTGSTTRSFWVGLSFAGPEATADSWPTGWFDVPPLETANLNQEQEQVLIFEFAIPFWAIEGSYDAVTAVWDGYDAENNLMIEPKYQQREQPDVFQLDEWVLSELLGLGKVFEHEDVHTLAYEHTQEFEDDYTFWPFVEDTRVGAHVEVTKKDPNTPAGDVRLVLKIDKEGDSMIQRYFGVQDWGRSQIVLLLPVDVDVLDTYATLDGKSWAFGTTPPLDVVELGYSPLGGEIVIQFVVEYFADLFNASYKSHYVAIGGPLANEEVENVKVIVFDFSEQLWPETIAVFDNLTLELDLDFGGLPVPFVVLFDLRWEAEATLKKVFHEYRRMLTIYPDALGLADLDGDGISNDVEVATGTDPFDDDTDDDGLLDGPGSGEDTNANGVVDPGETDPRSADTDGDGIQDGTESGLVAPEGLNTDLTIFVPDADPDNTTDPTNPDTDGDGLLDGEEDLNSNGAVDPGEWNPNVITGFIDFDPDTLNLKSKGKFVTVYIELPEDFDISEIDLFSLELNELVHPLPKPFEIGDYDNDGINDLMVKFSLQELIEVLEPGEQIIDLTGRLWDGRPIAGFDFIRVIH